MTTAEIFQAHKYEPLGMFAVAVHRALALDLVKITEEEAHRRFLLEDKGGFLLGVGGRWVSTPAQAGGFQQHWAGVQFADGGLVQSSRATTALENFKDQDAQAERFALAFERHEATWYAPRLAATETP